MNSTFATEFCSTIAHSPRLVDPEVALISDHALPSLEGGACSAYRATHLSDRGITIASIAFQLVAFGVTAGYLAFSATLLHQRNHHSWESLVSRLHPVWGAGASNYGAALLNDSSKRWSAFRDAGVLMQMADFADRTGTRIDPSVLASLRADAIHVRFAVLYSIVRNQRGR